MTDLTKSEKLLVRTCYKVLERASKLRVARAAARRQAATYAGHIKDLSGQIDELRAARDHCQQDRNLWRERALLARREYHEERQLAQRCMRRIEELEAQLKDVRHE